MNLKVRRLAWLLATIAAGCGGSSQPPADGGDLDGSVDGSSDVNADKGADAASDASRGPAIGPGSHLLFPGGVILIGSGPDSCTNGLPAVGDRWCGFMRPRLRTEELWVINVSKAAAGVAITCDTNDANCIRLSTGLYDVAADGGLRVHGFDGDTLIFYQAPSSAVMGFTGTIYGWRPGWSGAQKLTSSTGVACRGHQFSDAVICFENLAGDPAKGVSTAELHAVKLSQLGNGPVPKLDTFIVSTAADASGVRKWQADFSPDGATVAWSARPTMGGVETLNVEQLGVPTSRRVVAQDITRWKVTRDGTKWVWLKTFNYAVDGKPAGTLQTATFPDGGGVSTLATGVADFDNSGDKGIVFRSGVTSFVGDLNLIADREAPTVVRALDRNVLTIYDQTKDGSKISYGKGMDGNGFSDLFIASTSAARPCVVTADTAAAPIGTFLPSGSVAVWARVNDATGDFDGYYTTVDGCTSHKFASNILRWQIAGDQGFVYLDDASATVDEATLRFGVASAGKLPSPGTAVQARAASVYAPLLPALAAVVYTVGTGTAADGLYINATLPFTATPPAPGPDAGVDAKDASADAPDASAGASDGAAAPDVVVVDPDASAGPLD
jgi:hypothetical protein